MNQCTFLGRMTRHPETQEVGDTSVTQFGLAVQRSYKDKKTGEYGVDFFEMVCWGKRGETIEKYFSKGSPILVNANAVLDTWETEDGGKRSKIKFSISSFEFLPKSGDDDGPTSESEDSSEPVMAGAGNDEDIPF